MHEEPTSHENIDHDAVTSPGSAAHGETAPLFRTLGASSAPGKGEPRLPERIGEYRIERLLGEGGMGAVYLAEQRHPRRKVALKVIRAGIAGPRLMRRFEFEAQVLARLEHPSIARIYDAGMIDAGTGAQPFFAMEYVEGLTLDTYINRNRLSVRERLKLIAEICDAIHHAHQKGVIHRDLKPANILVDAAGRPRVLDFGVARATDADTNSATMRTDIGQLIGTVPYMSPEQLSGDPNDLDIRADVYALGVTAYEVLTGRLPHDVSRKTIVEAARIVQQAPIPAPRTFDTSLKGDIETILLKALAREKDRRYASASDLAADLRAYLRNEPIAARPASTIYQWRMFARRNRALVGGLAAVFVVLSAGVVVSTWGFTQAHAQRVIAEQETERARAAETRAHDAREQAEAERVEAERAREQAEQEAARALAIKVFLLDDMLGSADPSQSADRELTVREMLDAASDTIDRAFPDEPIMRLEVRNAIGRIYGSLGLYDRAEAQWREALDESTTVFGFDHPETLAARRNLALLARDQGRPDEAANMIDEILVVAERDLGPDHLQSAEARADAASIYISAGRFAEAEPMLRSALPVMARHYAPADRRFITARHNLATVLGNLGRHDEAVEMLREILAFRLERAGERDPDTLSTMNNLAAYLTERGRHEESEPLLHRVLEIREVVLGRDHPTTMTTRLNLVHLLIITKRFEEAEPLLRSNLELLEAKLGRTHPNTLTTLNQLAYLLEDTGDLARAEEVHRDALARWETHGGINHPQGMIVLNNLAMLLLRTHDLDEAQRHFDQLLSAAERVLSTRHPYYAIFRNNEGECLTRLGRLEEAERALRESHEIITTAFGEGHERWLRSLRRVIALYETWGKREEADHFRAQLPSVE